eukprot:5892053-Pyramimonas_sp.AAC.1
MRSASSLPKDVGVWIQAPDLEGQKGRPPSRHQSAGGAARAPLFARKSTQVLFYTGPMFIVASC